MERTSRETWAKRIERWKDSGLTAAEFAAEVGVNAHSLSWWKWRLGAEGRPAPARRGRLPRSTPRAGEVTKPLSPSPVTFVEMATATPEALEIVLPSTISIRVRPGFDEATLGRVLDVLERRR
jgi:hypothetical protein